MASLKTGLLVRIWFCILLKNCFVKAKQQLCGMPTYFIGGKSVLPAEINTPRVYDPKK